MVNFSFIIPHKNTPVLLQKCIDSIPHRNDVEIIVVDDNSDSSVVDFRNFPGNDDHLVKIIYDKVGGGCAHATNIAIDNAVGKWIVRADADDFFLPEIDVAMDEYVDSDYEYVLFKAASVKLPSYEPAHRSDVQNELIDKALTYGDYIDLLSNSCPWCRFYRREFIERYHLRLHEVRWSTEVTFCAQIAVLATKVIASPLCVYCVTDSEGTMVKDTSLNCRIVRFEEDSSALRILRRKFDDLSFAEYWHFRTWFSIYKVSKLSAIIRIPRAVYCSGGAFIKQTVKAIWS